MFWDFIDWINANEKVFYPVVFLAFVLLVIACLVWVWWNGTFGPMARPCWRELTRERTPKRFFATALAFTLMMIFILALMGWFVVDLLGR